MSVCRPVLVVFGCASVVLALLVYAQIQRIRADNWNELHDETRAQNVHELERVRQLKEQVEAAETEARALQDALQAPADSIPRPVSPINPIVLNEKVSKDPEYQLTQLSLGRAELRLKYGHMYRQLGLMPNEVEQFESARARLEEEMTDIWASAKQEGLSPNDPTLLPLRERLGQNYSQAQRALLGEERFQQWREYERTALVRQFVIGAAGAAALSGQPLNQSQAEGLLNAVIAAAPSNTRTINLNDIDWSIADAQASIALSPTQFAHYLSVAPVWVTSRSSVQFNQAMRKALAEEKAKGSAP